MAPAFVMIPDDRVLLCLYVLLHRLLERLTNTFSQLLLWVDISAEMADQAFALYLNFDSVDRCSP